MSLDLMTNLFVEEVRDLVFGGCRIDDETITIPFQHEIRLEGFDPG